MSDESFNSVPSARRFILWGCAAELGLLALAFLLARIAGVPPLADLRWSLRDALLACAATLPLLGVAALTLRSTWSPLVRIQEVLHQFLLPLLRGATLPQLALLSICAGVCEEVLFRAVLQSWIHREFGLIAALIAANVLFGICHFATPAYAVFAGVLGLYLSLLWLWTGNLLAPVITHAVYDFAVLSYLVHNDRRQG